MPSLAANAPEISIPPNVDVAALLRPQRQGARTRTWAGIFSSVLAHVSVFGGALLYAHILPPRTIPERPIMAKLVQLGAPKKKFLPRNSMAAAPDSVKSHGPKPINVPVAITVPRPDDDAVSLDNTRKAESEGDARKAEAAARQKKLEEALAKLEEPATGPAKTVNEREGHKDGVAEGDADTAQAGDMYAAQVKDALKRNFEVPSTISQQERLYLSCDLLMFIKDDGTIRDFKITKSSDNAQYDRAVEATLKKTKLPPPPKALAASYESDGLAVRFKP